MSKSQIERYREFAKIGSEKGDLYSTTVAIEAAENDYERFTLEKRLWEGMGHVNGAGALSDRYFEGMIKSNGSKDEPDYTLSFAYLTVEETLYNHRADQLLDQGDVVHVPNESANHSHFQYFEERKAKYAGYLNPTGEIEAKMLALKIIEDNKNCCERF